MRFAKGHGTGNDFVIVPDLDGRLDLAAWQVRRLCDRRTGIGADGVLRIVGAAAAAGQAVGASWFMDYRNADGSDAEMCGNGIRVLARYLADRGLAADRQIAIGTRSGVRVVRRLADGEFCVDMGPVKVGGAGTAVVGGRRCAGLAVWAPNPHLACMVTEPLAGFDLATAPEADPVQFPAGVNVELARITGDHAIAMRVHERGSGETLSCGTGAVAAAVAAAHQAGEWPGARRRWTVDVAGGRLAVTPDPQASLLTGPAVIVAEGIVDDAWLADPAAQPGTGAAPPPGRPVISYSA
jgi:diaminopimelate epimerase